MTLIPSTTAGGAEAIDLQPGTIVKCVTCYDKEITGEIAAFDINKKALVVVSQPPAESTKHAHNTVRLLNINNLKELIVLQERKSDKEISPLPSLDNTKLSNRVYEAVNEKKRGIASIGVGVTPEGQSLFNSIKKTIEDVKWNGTTIVVLGDVNIVEPYRENNLEVITSRGTSSFDHISKIVRKHYEDKRKPEAVA